MPSNPFLSRVGLKYEGATGVPIWVNSIPGISVELAANLRKLNAENEAKALWEQLQPVALDDLLVCLETQISAVASFQHILARTASELISPTKDQIIIEPGDWANLGVNCVLSADFASLQLGELSFISLATSDVEASLRIDDLFSGTSDLLSKDIVVKPGLNTVALDTNIAIKCNPMWNVIYLAPKEDVLTLQVINNPGSTDESLFYVESSEDTNPQITLHLQAEIRCDFTKVVARYAERLAWAYAYKCAALLMNEKLSSNRLNVFTNTNREDTEERVVEYNTEFETRLKKAGELILRDMTSSGSPYFVADPDVQPGITRGSYV